MSASAGPSNDMKTESKSNNERPDPNSSLKTESKSNNERPDPNSSLPVIQTELGPLLADETGVGELKERFNRRTGNESLERERKDDFGFEPVARIYQEFCAMHEVDLDKIDFDTRTGQQLRRELLLHLKDRGGLKYREIAKLPEFAGVKMNSLGSLYRYEKSKES
jgi:hypothetical protein